MGCHSQINPIGYAFEAFDGEGRHRVVENGVAIDTTGAITMGDAAGDGVAVGRADVGRHQRLRHAHEQAAGDGAGEVADAAQHRGDERLDPGHQPHQGLDLGIAQGDHGAGGGGERGAEHEGQRDDGVHVDTHQRRRIVAEADGAQRHADARAHHQPA